MLPVHDAAADAGQDRRAKDHLRSLSERPSAKGVRTEAHIVEDTGVAGRILAEAKRLKADAVVLGTHGRTGFGRLLLGSVAAEVLRAKAVEVVLVHTPAAGKAK